MIFCRGCGNQIHETAISCPICGASQYLTHKTTQKNNHTKEIINVERIIVNLTDTFKPVTDKIKTIYDIFQENKTRVSIYLLLYVSLVTTINALTKLEEIYSSIVTISLALYIHRDFIKIGFIKAFNKFIIYNIFTYTIASFESSHGYITYNIANILELIKVDSKSTYISSYEHNNYESLIKLASMEIPYYQYRYAEDLYFKNTGNLDKNISLADLTTSLNIFKSIKVDYPTVEYIEKISSLIDSQKQVILTQKVSTSQDRYEEFLKSEERHKEILNSAQNGDLSAIKALAQNYLNGHDVDKNIVLASTWLKKAYDLGDKESGDELYKIIDPLKSSLSSDAFFNLAISMGDSNPNGSEMQIKWFCKIVDNNFSNQENYSFYRTRLLNINRSLGHTNDSDFSWLCSYPPSY